VGVFSLDVVDTLIATLSSINWDNGEKEEYSRKQTDE